MKNAFCRIEKLIYLFVFGEIREKKNLRRDKVISWEIIAQTEREQEIMSPSVQKPVRQTGSVLLLALPALLKLPSFKNRTKAFLQIFFNGRMK